MVFYTLLPSSSNHSDPYFNDVKLKLTLKVDRCRRHFPDKSKPEHKHLLMDLIVHACDVSNPARKTSPPGHCEHLQVWSRSDLESENLDLLLFFDENS